MRNKILALALGLLLTMPYALHAEEVEITLMEVVQMGIIGGDSPLDDEGHMGDTPPHPTDFRAFRDGNMLSVTKLNEQIPVAQATVTKVSNGNIVLNQQFTESLSEQIAASGVYVLRIQTEGGALVGQFIVP